MSVKKFKFVSPGVFLNEIDNSQLARDPESVGPTIIGRLQQGPGLLPLSVGSMSEFIEIFGNPIPGGAGGDVWRDGNYSAPTYAAYAAQAYLRNAGPVNVVRLLGVEDPNSTAAGAAGWQLTNGLDATDPASAEKSAIYGLYLFSTGSKDARTAVRGHKRPNAHTQADHMTGTLAAVWYFEQGAIILSGNIGHPNGDGPQWSSELGHGFGAGAEAGFKNIVTGSNVLVKSSDSSKMEFKALLFDEGSSTTHKSVVFNFDRDSDKYIRKVFNTNPTLTNTDVITTNGQKKYWLGETYDRYIKDVHGLGTTQAGTNLAHRGAISAPAGLSAMIVPLHAQTVGLARRLPNQNSATGWVFSQDINGGHEGYSALKMQKLFRFVGINDGGWNTRHLKISITDVKAGNRVDPYGTFTVLIRRITDNDQRPEVMERFSQCTLNPNSNNYIARKIGDQYREWDTADDRYRIYGNHPNLSQFFRVEMDQDVDQGVTDPQYIPFGFYGPPRYKTTKFSTSAANVDQGATTAPDVQDLRPDVVMGATTAEGNFGADLIKGVGAEIGFPFLGLKAATTASMVYPTLPLRLTSSAEGLSDPRKSFFGVSTYRAPDDPKFDKSFVDVTRHLGSAYMGNGIMDADGSKTETSFYFTLDDLMCIPNSGSINNAGRSQPHYAPSVIRNAVYAPDARASGISYTAARQSYKDLLKTGFNKFTMPVYGGFDGLDITEPEPFRNSSLNGDETTSYGLASIKRAIDAVADPEIVEMNALAAPGINKPRVTNHMIRVCEDRADALAVIDLETGGYIPETENKDNFKTRIANAKVETALSTLESRGLNSSYACTFFPWVKIGDSISGQKVWVPPSVVALGTFANTEANSELWFAPAGFTRGGLTEGAAGIPVLQVSQRLSSKERDRLYENNVNPIAQFPAEGIVVFGQKTLQITPSALDRINVRRLMIFVKKQVSRIAARLLFDQNVQQTWDRFLGQVDPFLDSVKSRLGITEYKVILDETTTTPDLIDRNIMYAKIFLKPARAIEFIAIDFVITNSGASFED